MVSAQKGSSPNQVMRTGARSHIRQAIEGRKESDLLIAGYYLYIPFVAVAFAILGGALFLVLVPNIAGVAFAYLVIYSIIFAVCAILNYKLMHRLNAHFRREALLRAGLLEMLRQDAEAARSVKVETHIATIESLNQDAFNHEKSRAEMIAPMAAIPIIGIVFGLLSLRSLTGADASHDRRWHVLLNQMQEAYRGLGRDIMLDPGHDVPRRSFAAYAIVSLLLFPFLAYWYHVLIRDVNAHFQAQWAVEDELAKQLL